MVRDACKLVGSGDSILVWSEPWVPGLTDFKPLPKASLEEIPCLAVSQLMNQAKTDLNMGTLISLFDSNTIQAIQNIPKVENQPNGQVDLDEDIKWRVFSQVCF